MNPEKKRLGWLGTLAFAATSTLAGAQQASPPALPNAPSSLPQPTLSLKTPPPTLLPATPTEKKPTDPAVFQTAVRPKKESSLEKIRSRVSIHGHGVRVRIH